MVYPIVRVIYADGLATGPFRVSLTSRAFAPLVRFSREGMYDLEARTQPPGTRLPLTPHASASIHIPNINTEGDTSPSLPTTHTYAQFQNFTQNLKKCTNFTQTTHSLHNLYKIQATTSLYHHHCNNENCIFVVVVALLLTVTCAVTAAAAG